MAEAPHDQNAVVAKLGVLFSDGETLIPIALNASNNGLKVNVVDTVPGPILALYLAGKALPREGDYRVAWAGVSSDDPNIVLPIFVDADGAVLVDM